MRAGTVENERKVTARTLLFDVVIGWLYLLSTAFAVCLCLWLLYFFTFELDSQGMLVECVAFVESNTWPSLCLVGILAIATIHSV